MDRAPGGRGRRDPGTWPRRGTRVPTPARTLVGKPSSGGTVPTARPWRLPWRPAAARASYDGASVSRRPLGRQWRHRWTIETLFVRAVPYRLRSPLDAGRFGPVHYTVSARTERDANDRGQENPTRQRRTGLAEHRKQAEAEDPVGRPRFLQYTSRVSGNATTRRCQLNGRSLRRMKSVNQTTTTYPKYRPRREAPASGLDEMGHKPVFATPGAGPVLDLLWGACR